MQGFHSSTIEKTCIAAASEYCPIQSGPARQDRVISAKNSPPEYYDFPDRAPDIQYQAISTNTITANHLQTIFYVLTTSESLTYY